jgi:hypothetical protein
MKGAGQYEKTGHVDRINGTVPDPDRPRTTRRS